MSWSILSGQRTEDLIPPDASFQVIFGFCAKGLQKQKLHHLKGCYNTMLI